MAQNPDAVRFFTPEGNSPVLFDQLYEMQAVRFFEGYMSILEQPLNLNTPYTNPEFAETNLESITRMDFLHQQLVTLEAQGDYITKGSKQNQSAVDRRHTLTDRVLPIIRRVISSVLPDVEINPYKRDISSSGTDWKRTMYMHAHIPVLREGKPTHLREITNDRIIHTLPKDAEDGTQYVNLSYLDYGYDFSDRRHLDDITSSLVLHHRHLQEGQEIDSIIVISKLTDNGTFILFTTPEKKTVMIEFDEHGTRRPVPARIPRPAENMPPLRIMR